MNYPAILAILFGHAAGGVYICLGMPLQAIYFGLFALAYMLMLLKSD